MKKTTFLFITCSLLLVFDCSHAQPLNKKDVFTHQDTLRGTITPERAWWDVLTYNIYVAPDYNSKTIKGWNQISFSVTKPGKKKIMQIDLQEPMMIDSIFLNDAIVKTYQREGNVYWINFGDKEFKKNTAVNSNEKNNPSIKIFFHGTPREAINAPWDGGWIWTKDEKGRPWMTVACQGLGASVWYPCKDHQSDEPDLGALLQIKVPDTLVAVGNGRLYSKNDQHDGTTLYTWQVKNPINNYTIIPYIGKYVNFTDTLNGEKGKLDCSYWVIDYNLEKAKAHFDRDVKRMLHCFEYWFGPYPFYEDSYKLVESSHLGMEHQSATAYGNHYLDGYLGTDLSGTGWGKKFDYIIVHESGHEWFANNITTKDIADMWVHEGFTCYSESLFIECQYGKDAADEYNFGIRKKIRNRSTMIGTYGVNKESSGDIYNKGSNLLHTIRQMINDENRFRSILRGLNDTFYHKTIDSKDVENYFSVKSAKDLSKIFDQYLRTTNIPVLEYKITEDNFSYHWANCIDGFNMPVRSVSGDWLYPTTSWQRTSASPALSENFQADKNFYITVKKVQ